MAPGAAPAGCPLGGMGPVGESAPDAAPAALAKALVQAKVMALVMVASPASAEVMVGAVAAAMGPQAMALAAKVTEKRAMAAAVADDLIECDPVRNGKSKVRILSGAASGRQVFKLSSFKTKPIILICRMRALTPVILLTGGHFRNP